jgi:phosphoglycolate phosphatase-like HAD superfamily hydrolase
VRPLPGASELLAALSEARVPWAIATSGHSRSARPALELLGLRAETPLVTRDLVRYAKPDPDLFVTAAERIGVDIRDSIVVGDSVWDLLAARRARALGIGLLSGGTGGRSSSMAAPSLSARTPATCSPTSTRWACGDPCRRGLLDRRPGHLAARVVTHRRVAM